MFGVEKLLHTGKIDDLVRLERHLAATVEQCSGGHVPDCAVIDMLETARP